MSNWICFECGKKIHAPLQKFVSQEVYHEKDNSNKMRIYAHAKCVEDSPNKWPTYPTTEKGAK